LYIQVRHLIPLALASVRRLGLVATRKTLLIWRIVSSELLSVQDGPYSTAPAHTSSFTFRDCQAREQARPLGWFSSPCGPNPILTLEDWTDVFIPDREQMQLLALSPELGFLALSLLITIAPSPLFSGCDFTIQPLATRSFHVAAASVYQAICHWNSNLAAVFEGNPNLSLATTTIWPLFVDEEARAPFIHGDSGWTAIGPHYKMPIIFDAHDARGYHALQMIRQAVDRQTPHNRSDYRQIGVISLHIYDVGAQQPCPCAQNLRALCSRRSYLHLLLFCSQPSAEWTDFLSRCGMAQYVT
jgi:hypothetical protein